ELLFFPEAYTLNMGILKSGRVLFIDGKISLKDNEIKVIAEKAMTADMYIKQCSLLNLYIKCSSKNTDLINKILHISGSYQGKSSLIFYFDDLKQYVKPKNTVGVEITEKLLSEAIQIVGIENIALSK
ncbi:MAG: hypothetical protein IJX61_04340, partial [Ruminococcus sp.]|nr:hypothetical protein [Ruminococcus sp.]